MNQITIKNAREKNLKNLSLFIPKNKLTVFTGLSGSGKSTLLMDVLFQECQRQYLEAMSMQGIAKPLVDKIQGVSPAIILTQSIDNKNPRSTLGTMSDMYTGLRMLYEKLSIRECPHCHEMICAADCVEETEKIQDEFHVYMYCPHCHFKMKKLTRSYFSFNTNAGACPVCGGLGELSQLDEDTVLHKQFSLEEGAVDFWEQRYKDYMIESLYAAYTYYELPIPSHTAYQDFSELQKTILFDGVECDALKQQFPNRKPPKTVAKGKFEGIRHILNRRMAEKEHDSSRYSKYFKRTICPHCKGERLNELSRNVHIQGVRLPQLAQLSLQELLEWINQLEQDLNEKQHYIVKDYFLDLKTKIQRLINVGLGYLTLDRQTLTLSKGELQRIKLAAILDSDLCGIIYILDEPTCGLHPKDTQALIDILIKLKELGNTVLVIEHDPDVMKAADHIIDLGPKSGINGGELIASGTLSDILQCDASLTGQYLKKTLKIKSNIRTGNGNYLHIHQANQYNLKNLHVDIPCGCIIGVSGPSGSGKSTLIFEILAKGNSNTETNAVSGCEQFDEIIQVTQSQLNRSRRSNIATYCDMYSEIRGLFAKTKQAKALKLDARYFSFNSDKGRCENCEGMGVVNNHLLFFANTDIPCPVCHGNRFNDDVLSITYHDLNITDVLKLSVDEALIFFHDTPKLASSLQLLQDVGLGYLSLGQSLSTLSGGEEQRLKLARELIGKSGHNLYLMDEVTSGLHPHDIEHFLILLNKLCDQGNTIIIVEHNQQLLCACDYIIDLGYEGGNKGGEIVYSGSIKDFLSHPDSSTARCLLKNIK